MISFLRRVHWILSICGIDLLRVRSLLNVGRYLRDLAVFRRAGGNVDAHFPVLADYGAQAGSASGHYFHTDLLVAGFIFEANPVRHVDVGSRVDGFVSHVAAFRKIEIIDVRELAESEHPNIQFVRADAMTSVGLPLGACDSVSCLHALEHFGLGRYGDPIDPAGHRRGFANLVAMLKPGGMLYLAVPIGTVDEVHFNAHRVFGPCSVPNWANEVGGLELVRFDYVDDSGRLRKLMSPEVVNGLVYGCGIYALRKSGKV